MTRPGVAGDPAGDPMGDPAGACAACLERAWLVARLAGHLEVNRARALAILALPADELLAAVGGRQRRQIDTERAAFRAGTARDVARRCGLRLVCRCAGAYPARLLELPAPPAVLHVAGGFERLGWLSELDAVAVVGTRQPTEYGRGIAFGLGRMLATAGVPVVSGMARGIDAAAHAGALEAPSAPTVAVLPGPAHRSYPASLRGLHARLVAEAVVVSEIPPGTPVRRWMFAARNRIIAGLAELTVVVEAGERSGSLVTATLAGELERVVGAVPGRVTTAQAAGPHRLLAEGATLITGPQDVLDALYGAGARRSAADDRPAPSEAQVALLVAIENGHDTIAALTRAGLGGTAGLAELAALEIAGWLRRGAGGRYVLLP